MRLSLFLAHACDGIFGALWGTSVALALTDQSSDIIASISAGFFTGIAVGAMYAPLHAKYQGHVLWMSLTAPYCAVAIFGFLKLLADVTLMPPTTTAIPGIALLLLFMLTPMALFMMVAFIWPASLLTLLISRCTHRKARGLPCRTSARKAA